MSCCARTLKKYNVAAMAKYHYNTPYTVIKYYTIFLYVHIKYRKKKQIQFSIILSNTAQTEKEATAKYKTCLLNDKKHQTKATSSGNI